MLLLLVLAALEEGAASAWLSPLEDAARLGGILMLERTDRMQSMNNIVQYLHRYSTAPNTTYTFNNNNTEQIHLSGPVLRGLTGSTAERRLILLAAHVDTAVTIVEAGKVPPM